MTRDEIDKRIAPVDKQTISSLFGCSLRYVHYVLKGERNNEEMLKVAEKLITHRESVTEEMRQQLDIAKHH